MTEYGLGSEVSTKGDVYSYEILLLEMITGKRPTDGMFDEGLNLHNYANVAWPNRVLEIADPKLLNNNDKVIGNHNCTSTNRTNECLISMVKLGLACSMELPQERWDISKAISELQLIRDINATCLAIQKVKNQTFLPLNVGIKFFTYFDLFLFMFSIAGS